MTDLSVLIPARNEQFLARTIQDVLVNVRGDTEIIAVCDGAWPDPPIADHPLVHLVHHSRSVGQRAATNEAAKMSTARYIMKLDAHCAVDEGFDVKLMADCEPDWTVIPRMYNLHAFDWKCVGCGSLVYQGPRPPICGMCQNQFEMEIVWKPRLSRRTDFARFDRDLHFQYWRAYEKRPEAQGDLADVMCFVGACFFMERQRFYEIGMLDEDHGSWGQMGVEISCKSWLSGGRQVVNKKTWFAHMFRTREGFTFPYPITAHEQEKAREHSRQLWMANNWPGAVQPLRWLIDKFAPVPEWDKTQKGIVYYTDSRLDPLIDRAVKQQLEKVSDGKALVAVSLVTAAHIGRAREIVFPLERGPLTMFRQILAGLEACEAEIIFLCEHDVLYHPSHFDFVPPKKDVFYYNENVYKVEYPSGRAIFYYVKQTSGLCAYRELLLEHYRKRVQLAEKNGFSRKMGFEPGTHSRAERVDDYKAEAWMSEYPNIDIRHNKNLTPTRWSPAEFRDQRYTRGWTEVTEVPGWGVVQHRIGEILESV